MHSVERYLLNAIFRIIKPTPRNSKTPARLNLTLNYPVFANYLRGDHPSGTFCHPRKEIEP